jgi:phenylacetic acid degradation protein
MPLYELDGKRPQIGDGTWIAPSAEIIGNVVLGRNCYIGFGAILRADFGRILIGDESAVEEGVIIHEAHRVTIGNRVIIGLMAMIHDATIHDGVLIGMQSMICENAVIETEAIVAERSLVMKNQVVPSGKIYGGSPASEIGVVGKRHREMFRFGQNVYASLPETYRKGFKKVSETV